MKSIISDRDVQNGFLRCVCDTKYAADTFPMLQDQGCRVCGQQFVRITEAETAAKLLQLAGEISPEMATTIALLFREKR